MLFRAQIPMALTSLVPAADKRLLLIFECHAGYLGTPCNSGTVVITGDETAPRTSAICTSFGVVLRDLGPVPEQVTQVVRSLSDDDESEPPEDQDFPDPSPPVSVSTRRKLKPTHSRRPPREKSGSSDPDPDSEVAFLKHSTGCRRISGDPRLPAMVLTDLPASMGSEVVEILSKLGAKAELVPMAPTTLPAVRGGKLIAFDDAVPGLRKTTLPPLDEIRALFGQRSIRGLIGGATPGYRDYAFRCSCGRRTRTAVRLLADPSMKGIRLGAAVAQICTHCGTGNLYRM
jgi:hypothetical protein